MRVGGRFFPGGFKRGDIVSRRKDFDSPIRSGCVIRTAYDADDGRPLVIVHWINRSLQIEAPEDLFKRRRSTGDEA